MTGNNGLLSICCTCYNHEKYVEDCIQSIWDNDYKNIEIIVIDDGSKDNSVEVLKKLKDVSPCPFEIISQENTGFVGRNFNRAAKLAHGEFITFMSCDDCYTKDAFSKKIELMEQDTAFILSRKVCAIKEDLSVCEGVQISKDIDKNTPIEELIELEYSKDTFSIQGMIMRKEVFDAFGGFDDDIQGDDIVLRIKMFRYMQDNPKWKFNIIDDPSFIYRRHANNNSKNNSWIINIYLDVFDRYWADRPYPKHVIKSLCSRMHKGNFKDYMPILINHPRFLNLILEDNRFARNLSREFDNYLNKNSIIDFFVKKEEFYDRDIYTVLGFIRISRKIKERV